MLLFFVLSCAKDTPVPDSSASVEQTDGSSESGTLLEFRGPDPGGCTCYLRVNSVSDITLSDSWQVEDITDGSIGASPLITGDLLSWTVGQTTGTTFPSDFIRLHASTNGSRVFLVTDTDGTVSENMKIDFEVHCVTHPGTIDGNPIYIREFNDPIYDIFLFSEGASIIGEPDKRLFFTDTNNEPPLFEYDCYRTNNEN